MKKYILISILIFLVLVACGSPKPKSSDKDSTKATEVIFWHAMGGPLGEALTSLIDEFNTSQSEVFVNAINMGNYTALSQKMMASIQAGTQPDIVQAFEAWTAGLVNGGVIVPMQKFMDADADFTDADLADIFPVFINSNTIDDTLWTMPFNKSVRVLYYNKDMLFSNDLDPNIPPTTWAEFKAVCKKLTKDANNDGTPEIYGTTFPVSAWQFENLLLQAGGSIMNETYTNPLFDSPYGVEAINFLNDLLNEDKSAYLSTGYEGQTDFLAGKVGIVEGSSVSLVYMRRNGINFNLGISAIPTYKTKRSVISGTNVAIFKKEDKTKENAAWQFVKWFTDTKQTARWAAQTYYMPIRRSSLNDSHLKQLLDDSPEIRSVFEQLESASFEPPIKEWYKTRKMIEEKVLEKVFRGTLDAQTALKMTADEIRKELKKGQE